MLLDSSGSSTTSSPAPGGSLTTANCTSTSVAAPSASASGSQRRPSLSRGFVLDQQDFPNAVHYSVSMRVARRVSSRAEKATSVEDGGRLLGCLLSFSYSCMLPCHLVDSSKHAASSGFRRPPTLIHALPPTTPLFPPEHPSADVVLVPLSSSSFCGFASSEGVALLVVRQSSTVQQQGQAVRIKRSLPGESFEGLGEPGGRTKRRKGDAEDEGMWRGSRERSIGDKGVEWRRLEAS